MSLGLIEKMDGAGKFKTGLDDKYERRRSDFNQLHQNETLPKDAFDKEFWDSMSAEEREAEYESFIADVEKNIAGVTDKMVEINFTPHDHDSFRENLAEVLENAKEYNRKNGPQFIIAENMKVPDPIPEDEQRRRKALYTDWERKTTEELVRMHAQINASTFFARRPVERETQIFLCGGSMKDVKERYEIITSGTTEQKKEFFEGRLSEVLDFVEEMQEYKSDEDFLKAVEGKRWMLGMFSELDKTHILNDFGFKDVSELSPALLDRWNQLRDVAVSLGNLQNRVDQIISPMYAIVNPGDLTDDWMKFIEGALDEELAEDIGYTEPEDTASPALFSKMLNTEQGRINPIFDYSIINALENTPNYRIDSLKHQMIYAAKETLGFDELTLGFCDEAGKALKNVDEAAALLSEGKTVGMTNGALYVSTLTINAANGTKTPQLCAPSPITCNKNPSADSFDRFIKNTGKELSARDREYALEALKAKSDAYASHGFFWRLFHRSERNFINTMKTALADKGVTKTEILVATKGDRLTEKEYVKAINGLVNEFRLANGEPEKCDLIVRQFDLLTEGERFERLAANGRLAEVYRQAKEIIPSLEEEPKPEIDEIPLVITENGEIVSEISGKKLEDELKRDTDPEKGMEPEKPENEPVKDKNPEKLP